MSVLSAWEKTLKKKSLAPSVSSKQSCSWNVSARSPRRRAVSELTSAVANHVLLYCGRLVLVTEEHLIHVTRPNRRV